MGAPKEVTGLGKSIKSELPPEQFIIIWFMNSLSFCILRPYFQTYMTWKHIKTIQFLTVGLLGLCPSCLKSQSSSALGPLALCQPQSDPSLTTLRAWPGFREHQIRSIGLPVSQGKATLSLGQDSSFCWNLGV